MRIDAGAGLSSAVAPEERAEAEAPAESRAEPRAESSGFFGGVAGFFRGAAGYAVDGAKAVGRAAVGTTNAVRSMAANAKAVVKILSNAEGDAGDAAKLSARFMEALPAIAPQVDAKADAISIGYLGEAGIGFCDAKGTEILYVRAKGDQPARLRVSEVEGLVARVNVGVTTKAFFRCIYGEPEEILAARKRLGTEVGAAIASVSFFRAVQPREDRQELTAEEIEVWVAPTLARGWTGAIGGGLGINLPVISDASAFNLTEKLAVALPLSADQSQKIEDMLRGAPDRNTLRDLAKKS